MFTQRIDISIGGNRPYRRIKMREGDSGRILKVSVIADGQPFSMNGFIVEFRARKADGTLIVRQDGIEHTDDVATVKITANTLAIPRIVECELVIIDHLGTEIGTAVWEIDVTAAAVTTNKIKSTNDFQSVQAAVSKAEQYRDEAGQFAADAATSESAAKQSEQLAAQSAAAAGTSASQAESQARAAAASVASIIGAVDEAQDAASLAGLEADRAETAKDSAEAARDAAEEILSQMGQYADGDMNHEDYDKDRAVKNAGGIKAFIQGFFESIKDSFVALATPTGSIKMYVGETPPTGFLLLNGQAVSREEYARLFALCGIRFGSGDGSTTFNVPDMRNRFPLGFDANLGVVGGSEKQSLTTEQLPRITARAQSGSYPAYLGGTGTKTGYKITWTSQNDAPDLSNLTVSFGGD